MKEKWRDSVSNAVLILGPLALLAPIIYVAVLLVTSATDFYSGFVFQHYLVFFGMPYAGFFAYYLVTALESSRGPIEVEFVGFKFKGAAGPLVFWLLVFLSIQLGFSLFWK
jgi:hypothetical protein